MTIVDQVVLLVYLVGIVLFGCYFSRKNTDSQKFMDAGGSLPGWVVGLSLFGTYLSSISFLANPGKTYRPTETPDDPGGNWNPFVFSLSLPIAAWIACKWFVPFYRKTQSVSAYSHLGTRYGTWAKNYVIVCYILTQTVRAGAVLLLVAMAVNSITGYSIVTLIIGLGIAVIVYTLIGGIEAVIWTDVIQSIVLTIGIFVAIGFILAGMPQGPKQVFEIALENQKFSLGEFSGSLGEPTFWVILVYGLVINLQNFGIDQSYVQRYATARDEEAAKKSVWLACWLYLPISALLFFVGTALFSFYEAQPELLESGVKSDQIFAYFISTRLPVGFVGLMIAAIMAAAMSSVDSSLNSCATLICKDIAPKFNDGQIRDSKQVERRAKWILLSSTIVIGLISVGVAVFLNGTESILDAWWKLAGIFSGGMLGLFLLGMLVQQSRSIHAMVGVLAGLLLIIWMTASPLFLDEGPLRYPWHANLIVVLGTATILLIGFLATQLMPDSKGAK